jgi:ADP-ribose pyrophosphatase YjhB (NUDIX family)
MGWKPHVTVSAVAERDGRFLMVEELVEDRAMFNQPAGHLDEDESLVEAVMREVLEETAWEFVPEHVTGLYLWKSRSGRTFLRINFFGHCLRHHPDRGLDDGILRAAWMSRAELVAAGDRLRSPMVLRCLDDHLAGRRYPLDVLTHLETDH